MASLTRFLSFRGLIARRLVLNPPRLAQQVGFRSPASFACRNFSAPVSDVIESWPRLSHG